MDISTCEVFIFPLLAKGIGYFTLPYLVHAKAHLVHACEWNPDAAEALKRNLRLNGVEDRCVVHHGDNREVSRRSRGGDGRGQLSNKKIHVCHDRMVVKNNHTCLFDISYQVFAMLRCDTLI